MIGSIRLFAIAFLVTVFCIPSTFVSADSSGRHTTQEANSLNTEPLEPIRGQRAEAGANSTKDASAETRKPVSKEIANLLKTLNSLLHDLERSYVSAGDLYDELTPSQQTQIISVERASIEFDNGKLSVNERIVSATVEEHHLALAAEIIKVRLIRDMVKRRLASIRDRDSNPNQAAMMEREELGRPANTNASRVRDALIELSALIQLQPAQTTADGVLRVRRICELLRTITPFMTVEEKNALSDVTATCALLN